MLNIIGNQYFEPKYRLKDGVNLDKFELKATISDILNQSRDYYQDMDKNKVYNAEKDLLIERTNFGTTYSFALSYKF